MLGLMIGFATSDTIALPIAIKACLSAAVALFVSGLSSAYLSETAERKRELNELEHALLSDLSDSDYGKASRYVPVMVALVNGLSPLIISLVILTPLFLVNSGVALPLSPFIAAGIIALTILFILGAMLGRLSGEFWLWTGIRTLLFAAIAIAIISVI